MIGTGEEHSVEDFLKISFKHAGLDYKNILRLKKFYRPSEVDLLLADYSKAKKIKMETKCIFQTIGY